MKARSLFCWLCATAFSIPLVYAEENPIDSCQAAIELYKKGNIDEALGEARWCVESLEQIKQQQISKHFKDEINGFTGGKLSAQKAMGITMIERKYTKDNQSIKVTLTGAGGAAGMGAFGALAQMGLMQSGKKIRIQRKTAIDTSQGKRAELTVSLNNGGLLKFESSNTDIDIVTSFAKAFPITELDKSGGG